MTTEFKKVTPLYFIGKDNKPTYYGIGAFFNKKPAPFFRVVNDKEHFSLGDLDPKKAETRQAALAKLLTSKLALTSYGKQIYADKEHSYNYTVTVIAQKAKVDVSASATVTREKADDDLMIVLKAMEQKK
jgi:biopolymer transport protein ExbD